MKEDLEKQAPHNIIIPPPGTTYHYVAVKSFKEIYNKYIYIYCKYLNFCTIFNFNFNFYHLTVYSNYNNLKEHNMDPY
jgi:hypothetical protein